MDSENTPIKDLNKADVFYEANSFLLNKLLEPVLRRKKSAADTDLIGVGRNMKTALDKIPNLDQITHVIIENQISPIATRMKTIQGMLAQYFIMRGSPKINIEFVSSSNKLKGLSVLAPTPAPAIVPSEGSPVPSIQKNKYKQNKKDGIKYCSLFLSNNPSLKEWEWTMKMTKKDDYADCFLQAVWYLKQQQRIQYSVAGENAYQLTPATAT